jgi:NitT/TauT family transport system substrate-binding protein
MKRHTRRALLKSGAAAALGSTLPLSNSRAQTMTKIRFAGSAAVARADQGFMFAGIPTGIYKQLGVEADFVTVAGSAASMQLVIADQAQLAHVGMLELLTAKRTNPTLPIQAVYLQDIGSAYEIVVPEDGPIKSVADLKGKKIGVISLATGAIPVIKAMLHQAKLDPDSVEMLPVGTGAQALAALKSDRVQALSLFRGSHAAIENLGVKLHYFTASVPSSVLAANTNQIAKNRDGLVRALQGVVMNSVYLQTNPAAGVRAFWKMFGEPTGDKAKDLQDNSRLISRAAELWKPLNSPGLYGDMNDKTWLDMLDFIGPSFEFDRSQIKNVYTSSLIADVNKADIKKAAEMARADKS